MVHECDSNGKELFSKAAVNFPNLFRGSYKANKAKASSWWKLKDQYSAASEHPESLQRNQQCKSTRMNSEAVAGRGRKTNQLVDHVHEELIEELQSFL